MATSSQLEQPLPDLLQGVQHVLQRPAVSTDDHSRMHLLLQKLLSHCQHLTGWRSHRWQGERESERGGERETKTGFRSTERSCDCVPRFSSSSSPSMMTEVVPSPTSSSCVRLISIIDFAAGCCTWICCQGNAAGEESHAWLDVEWVWACEWLTSLRMAFPSLVITIPPVGSSSIYIYTNTHRGTC